MRITKIEITNYKSIKEPVEINYYNGLPTVLIGKNGSGKTNILEALSAVAEANGNYFGMRKELPLKYKVHIRLEKEDAERLFPGKSIDEKMRICCLLRRRLQDKPNRVGMSNSAFKNGNRRNLRTCGRIERRSRYIYKAAEQNCVQ